MIEVNISEATRQVQSPILDADYYDTLRPEPNVEANENVYFPMEVIHPRANAGAMARHKHAYTGDSYRCPIGVAFGKPPLKYKLVKGHPNMTLKEAFPKVGNEYDYSDKDVGLLKWDVAEAGSFDIVVRVTDQDGAVATLSWTLIVDTESWVTVDTSAATNGSGTNASPFNTITSLNSLAATKLARFKSGTVDLFTRTAEFSGATCMAKTWVAAPGQTVNIIQGKAGGGTSNAFLWVNQPDCYFEGFVWKTLSDRIANGQIVATESCDRVTFDNNVFDLENQAQTPTAANASTVMNRQASTSNYHYFSRNVTKNCPDRDYWLGYTIRNALFEFSGFEDNVWTGANPGGWGIYLKIDTSYICVRYSYSVGNLNTPCLARIDAYSGASTDKVDFIEFSHNSYRHYGTGTTGLGCILIGTEVASGGTHVYISRNSLYSNAGCGVIVNGWANTGVVTLEDNAIVSGGTNTNGVRVVSSNPPTVNNTGYLAGNLASGILDANNKLGSSYSAQLGLVGAQIA